jgi:acyl-CoA thioesterase-1
MIQRRAVDRIIKDLETIARRLEARPCKVLLCGMRAPPWAGLYGRSFDAVYPIVAARVNAPLLPFLLEGVALDPALNLADGIHPNVHGVQRMAETLAPAVLDALGVRAG